MIEISIIIPTINRGERIVQTIHCLTKDQDFDPACYEVIVVDGGSTDNTQKVVQKLAQELSTHNLKLIVEPTPGVMPARHRGVREALGALICFVEDDARAIPQYLTSVVDAFSDPDVHLVGGPCRPDFQAKPPRWLRFFWQRESRGRSLGYLSLIDLGAEAHDTEPESVWALNYCMRKETFYEVKGFNPDLVPKFLMRYQGDGETGLSSKIRSAGYRARYHPGVCVYHETPAERMDAKHFGERAYFQGVCDSYTAVRKNGEADVLGGDSTKKPRWLRYSRRPHYLLRDACNYVVIRMRKLVSPAFREYLEVADRMARCYREGYEFHQGEVRGDPDLLRWVLMEDYLDSWLPVESRTRIHYSDRPYV